MILAIQNADVILTDAILPQATVWVEDGVMRGVWAAGQAPSLPAGAEVVDAGRQWLAPGLIDLHLHGLHTHLVDKGPEAVAHISRLLPRYGVTGWLPTVSPIPAGQDVALLRSLSVAPPAEGACVLGFHLEGPFLTLAGALPREALAGADLARAERLIEAVAPQRAVFSISPEFPGIGTMIPKMRAGGAPVFMTHTGASVAETQAAIEAGARHATHFYDVFPVPPETDPGVRPCGAVEAILADPRVSVDFILDGVHVDPVAVQMALECKGPDRVCLISDAMVGAGLPCGLYRFGNKQVCFTVAGGPARELTAEGKPGGLAGSGLTLDVAVRNAVRLLGLDLPLAIRMASANPATVLGLSASKGRIAVGYDADLVLFDRDLRVQRAWVGGRSA